MFSFRAALFRAILLIGLVSILASAALLFLGSITGYEEYRGGYAVLSTDASVNDRDIIYLLNDQFNAVSESSQIVMLDTFNSFEAVPLDKYFSRVYSFDPRYDGYAEKLRDVFIKDGKRFVYMPLTAGNWNSALLDNQIGSLLGDIHFSVDYYGIGKPLFLFFLMYAAASLCFFIICCATKKNRYKGFKVIALIPVFSSLAFFGAPGLGCAALLFALFILLKEPLGEFFALKKKRLELLYKEIIIPYKHSVILLPVFAAALLTIVFFSRINPFFILAVIVTALCVYLFALGVLINVGKHRRFTPVLIIKRILPDFAFSYFILPFAAAVFLTMFFAPYQAGAFISNDQFDTFVNEKDYIAHLTNQSSFSTRRLGEAPGAYPSFFFDADGLPSVRTAAPAQTVNLKSFPPFPADLRHLMDFFHDVNSREKRQTDIINTDGFSTIADKFSLFVLLLFIVPGFIINRKYSKKDGFSGLKKINKNIRCAGITRNASLLYNNNERNQKRERKEA